MGVRAIPEGYHAVTPYLIVNDAKQALEFYKEGLGATELFRMDMGSRIGHAEFQIGDSRIMVSDEFPEAGAKSPKTLGGSPVLIHLYVDNVDTFVERAVGAGAKVIRPVADQFYGDRSGGFEDPFGHLWHVATHIEDVSPDEMQRRMAQMG